jgi:hypothetical protein
MRINHLSGNATNQALEPYRDKFEVLNETWRAYPKRQELTLCSNERSFGAIEGLYS